MPTYEYRCEKGHEFEAFQKMSDSPLTECPECGARAVRKISSGAGLVFKGSGFYITDYKRAGDKKSEGKAEGKGGGGSGDGGKGDGGSSAKSDSGGEAGSGSGSGSGSGESKPRKKASGSGGGSSGSDS